MALSAHGSAKSIRNDKTVLVNPLDNTHTFYDQPNILDTVKNKSVSMCIRNDASTSFKILKNQTLALAEVISENNFDAQEINATYFKQTTPH